MSSQECHVEEDENQSLGLQKSAEFNLENNDDLFCQTRDLSKESHLSLCVKSMGARNGGLLTPWQSYSLSHSTYCALPSPRDLSTGSPQRQTDETPSNPRNLPFLSPVELSKLPLQRPSHPISKFSKTSKIVLSALGLTRKSPKEASPENRSVGENGAGSFLEGTTKSPSPLYPRTLVATGKKLSPPLLIQDLKKEKTVTRKHFPLPGYLKSPLQQTIMKTMNVSQSQMHCNRFFCKPGQLPPISPLLIPRMRDKTKTTEGTFKLPHTSWRTTSDSDWELTKQKRQKEETLGGCQSGLAMAGMSFSSGASEWNLRRSNPQEKSPALLLSMGEVRKEPEITCKTDIRFCAMGLPHRGLSGGECVAAGDNNVSASVTHDELSIARPLTNEEDRATSSTHSKPSPVTSENDVLVKQKNKQSFCHMPSEEEKGESSFSSPQGTTLARSSRMSSELPKAERELSVLDRCASPFSEITKASDSSQRLRTEMETEKRFESAVNTGAIDCMKAVICADTSDAIGADDRSGRRSVEIAARTVERGIETKKIDIPCDFAEDSTALLNELRAKADILSNTILHKRDKGNRLRPQPSARSFSLFNRAPPFFTSETSNSTRGHDFFPSMIKTTAAYSAKMAYPYREKVSPAEQSQNMPISPARLKLLKKQKFIIDGMTKIYGGQCKTKVSCAKPPMSGESTVQDSFTSSSMQKTTEKSNLLYQVLVQNFVKNFKVPCLHEAFSDTGSTKSASKSQAGEGSGVQKTSTETLLPVNKTFLDTVDSLATLETPSTLVQESPNGSKPPAGALLDKQSQAESVERSPLSKAGKPQPSADKHEKQGSRRKHVQRLRQRHNDSILTPPTAASVIQELPSRGKRQTADVDSKQLYQGASVEYKEPLPLLFPPTAAILAPDSPKSRKDTDLDRRMTMSLPRQPVRKLTLSTPGKRKTTSHHPFCRRRQTRTSQAPGQGSHKFPEKPLLPKHDRISPRDDYNEQDLFALPPLTPGGSSSGSKSTATKSTEDREPLVPMGLPRGQTGDLGGNLPLPVIGPRQHALSIDGSTTLDRVVHKGKSSRLTLSLGVRNRPSRTPPTCPSRKRSFRRTTCPNQWPNAPDGRHGR